VKKYCLILSLISLISSNVFAAFPKLPDGYLWVGTASLGLAFQDNGNTQTINLGPDLVKTYAANHATTTIDTGELFLGVQKNLPQQFQGQLGLALAAAGNARLKGQIWDDADPTFNNYDYIYRVNHRSIGIKAKLLADRCYWLIPWLSLSLGVGFNEAHKFTNTPTLFEALPNPNFTSNSTTSFTYTLGIGGQKTLNKHWQAGIAYEFSDWGKSQLAAMPGQTSGNGPLLNHLYTNGILINFTYLA
jgi:opacity protein-like surface antigen